MLAAGYDALLFDLDGVLYRGDEPLPHARETMGALREAGSRMVFLTNNSSRTPEQVAAKLEAMGIAAASSEVVTSALATAELLAPRGGTAYVVGQDGIRTALADAGIRIVGGEPERVDHVVVGVDVEATYATLRTACVLVQRGARLVATNPDRSFPAAGALWPGAGALLAVITETTGAPAEVVGKPFAPLFETARGRVGATRPLVVGDRLDTDIAGAEVMGWDSLLVLTGVTTAEDLAAAPERPTYVAADLRALVEEPAQRSGRNGTPPSGRSTPRPR
ncbi:MAG: HAD-IIA family hydrolase [Actinomycetota bacterium]